MLGASIRKRDSRPADSREALRGELVRFLQGLDLGSAVRWDEDPSLLRSGLIDSMALFHLVGWIEQQTGAAIDPGSLDIASEWDTVSGILRFVEERRGDGPSGEDRPDPD